MNMTQCKRSANSHDFRVRRFRVPPSFHRGRRRDSGDLLGLSQFLEFYPRQGGKTTGRILIQIRLKILRIVALLDRLPEQRLLIDGDRRRNRCGCGRPPRRRLAAAVTPKIEIPLHRRIDPRVLLTAGRRRDPHGGILEHVLEFQTGLVEDLEKFTRKDAVPALGAVLRGLSRCRGINDRGALDPARDDGNR